MRKRAFLDPRVLNPQTRARSLPWAEIARAIDAAQLKEHLGFIFHIGHVGSTLLSRLWVPVRRVLSARAAAVARFRAPQERARTGADRVGRRWLRGAIDLHASAFLAHVRGQRTCRGQGLQLLLRTERDSSVTRLVAESHRDVCLAGELYRDDPRRPEFAAGSESADAGPTAAAANGALGASPGVPNYSARAKPWLWLGHAKCLRWRKRLSQAPSACCPSISISF